MFSQNVLFHAQVKKFFTSLKSHVPSLRYAALFLSISWNLKPNLKSVTSWWALAQREGSFWIYIFNHKLLDHETLFSVKIKKLVHCRLRAKFWQKMVLQRTQSFLWKFFFFSRFWVFPRLPSFSILDIGQNQKLGSLGNFHFFYLLPFGVNLGNFFVAYKSRATIKGRKILTYKREHQVDQGYEKFI